MHRPLLAFALLLLVSAPRALAQDAAPPVERAEVLPPDPLSTSQPLARPVFSSPQERLSGAEVLRRISRVYRYQSDLLEAQARGDEARADALLHEAMNELAVLLEQPGVMEEPRFRELYRTVVTEYEDVYGAAADSLQLQQGDIFRFRAEAFAALEAVDDPLLEDVTFPDLTPAGTVVPMTKNRLVRQSIAYLLRQPEKHLHLWLSRADTYFPMIEHVLEEEGAPDELKYLAMIESGLNPQAKSWARAVGMWQFMAATGRAYDLQVNAWVDERRDPEKATRAAGRHLQDLYETFGDWHLALAAYNCGAGNVRKALRRVRQNGGGAPTFWNAYPYLPRETRNYVPMYIAAALVASNPAAFGVDTDDVPAGPTYAYDHVPVTGSLAMSDVAALAGTDAATIRALNPELRRSYTPPAEGAYYVRIPKGTYARFAEGYAKLPDEKKRPVTQYTVRRGDNLGRIANKYGVSVSALKRRNGLRGSLIHPGQALVVPVPDYSGGVALADAEPKQVEYGQRAVRPIAALRPGTMRPEQQPEKKSGPPIVKASYTPEPKEERAPAPKKEAAPEKKADAPEATTYTVRRGDTLGEIGERHGVSITNLKRWNGLRSSRIRVGQRLKMYGAQTPAAPEKTTYTVRRGDTLSEIAKKHGVSVASLKQQNGLRSSRIRAGQRLTIRGGEGATAVVYEVQRGDSLGKIARKYDTSVSKIKQWNGLRSNTIRPGQRLKINT